MNTTLAVQRALLSRGYDIGPARDDGKLGRATIAAVAKFQADAKLFVQRPGKIGPKTLQALGLTEAAAAPVDPAWIAAARPYLGKHEVRDAALLEKALRLNVSAIPWCGAFVGLVVGTVLPQERLPANPLSARNWLKFGDEIPKDKPQLGAIAVFWRGSKTGWSGHVGFVVGHDATHLHILGGNQSDAVTIARIAKNRLLGLRWPSTAGQAPDTVLAASTNSATVTTNEA